MISKDKIKEIQSKYYYTDNEGNTKHQSWTIERWTLDILEGTELLIYNYIKSFIQIDAVIKPAYMSNNHLCEVFKINEQNISKAIKKIIEKGLITCLYVQDKEILNKYNRKSKIRFIFNDKTEAKRFIKQESIKYYSYQYKETKDTDKRLKQNKENVMLIEDDKHYKINHIYSNNITNIDIKNKQKNTVKKSLNNDPIIANDNSFLTDPIIANDNSNRVKRIIANDNYIFKDIYIYLKGEYNIYLDSLKNSQNNKAFKLNNPPIFENAESRGGVEDTELNIYYEFIDLYIKSYNQVCNTNHKKLQSLIGFKNIERVKELTTAFIKRNFDYKKCLEYAINETLKKDADKRAFKLFDFTKDLLINGDKDGELINLTKQKELEIKKQKQEQKKAEEQAKIKEYCKLNKITEEQYNKQAEEENNKEFYKAMSEIKSILKIN